MKHLLKFNENNELKKFEDVVDMEKIEYIAKGYYHLFKFH